MTVVTAMVMATSNAFQLNCRRGRNRRWSVRRIKTELAVAVWIIWQALGALRPNLMELIAFKVHLNSRAVGIAQMGANERISDRQLVRWTVRPMDKSITRPTASQNQRRTHSDSHSHLPISAAIKKFKAP